MNEDVNYLCNKLVYGHQLQCGTPQVAAQCLTLPHMSKLTTATTTSTSKKSSSAARSTPGQKPCADWILQVMQPQRRVTFLDTDALVNRLESSGSRHSNGSNQPVTAGRSLTGTLVNTAECSIVLQLLQALEMGESGCMIVDVSSHCIFMLKWHVLEILAWLCTMYCTCCNQ